jgi:hypothetical protein
MARRGMKPTRLPSVLQVIDTTVPSGAGTVFLALAEGCVTQDYRSIALLRGPGWVEQQLKQRPIPYYARDCKGSLSFRFLFETISFTRKEKVTHIKSHLLGRNVCSTIAGLVTRLPVTAIFHGHVEIFPDQRFRNAKLALVKIGARHVVAFHEDMENTIYWLLPVTAITTALGPSSRGGQLALIVGLVCLLLAYKMKSSKNLAYVVVFFSYLDTFFGRTDVAFSNGRRGWNLDCPTGLLGSRYRYGN